MPSLRILPRSLFGRLALVLFAGLLLAQGLSAWINFAERDRLLLHASGRQPAQRIADIVKLLDSIPPGERARIVAILAVPPQQVSLERAPIAPTGAQDHHVERFAAVLRGALGSDREMRLTRVDRPNFPRRRDSARGAGDPTWRPRSGEGWPPGGGPGRGTGFGAGMGMGMGPGMMEPGSPMGAMMRDGFFYVTQVRLLDGTWVTFDIVVPQESADLPGRMLATLLVSLAVIVVLSLVAVRWVVRPLRLLATAADELGHDIDRAPLQEAGPLEVRDAARAFNAMQARLQRFIRERTRILAAMSHDLKTPLTRMRLRVEMLDDDVRERFEKDLAEMEAMVVQTLEFMRGLGSAAERRPVDIDALLESLQADHAEMGREVRIEGEPAGQIMANAPLLRRCLGNLLDNAAAYAGAAVLRVAATPRQLVITVLDEGPGIPEEDLEKVFEPFHRLEASRSRATGGTGLGLTIARNIAQAHGGDVVLRNRGQGGLEAIVTLARGGGAPST